MLQQTRVEAVLPYYERFLALFPDIQSLAAAPEEALLKAWSGLGYYSRARNLREAARVIIGSRQFPSDYDALKALPGIGDYTAAAIASIAFGQPHAALDGNVARVLARVMSDAGDITSSKTKRRLQVVADDLLDVRRAGDFNQAMMELGATVCTPRHAECLLCPVVELCRARREGRERELPVRNGQGEKKRIDLDLLIVERRGRVLMWQRPLSSARLAGFWEFPEAGKIEAKPGRTLGEFRHTITNNHYRVEVVRAEIIRKPQGFHWVKWDDLCKILLSTTAKKAVLCLKRAGLSNS
jgi:A/G-specific adenine glycosylase